nr:glycosyl transferase [Ensifer sp. ENS05]
MKDLAMVRLANEPGTDVGHGYAAIPETALLSNGRYSVLLTESGAGYACWRGLDVTRWRQDTTRDCWGQFCYLEDIDSGKLWSLGKQPIYRGNAIYKRTFLGNRAELQCKWADIAATMTVYVAPDCDAEIRLLRLVNKGASTKKLRVTSYCEVCLHDRRADSAHPAFAKLFVETWFDSGTGALFARRRPRSALETPTWAVHVSALRGHECNSIEYETDRSRFLGRGGTASNAHALGRETYLSGTTGPVLDPMFSLRRTLFLEASGTAEIAFVTGAADNHNDVLAMARQFTDIRACDKALARAKENYAHETGALKLNAEKVATYNRLAAALTFSHPGFGGEKPLGERPFDIEALWSIGVSGDLPIALLRLDAPGDTTILEDAINAHTFISERGLSFDLVVLDDSATPETSRLLADIKGRLERERVGKRGGLHFPSGATPSSSSAVALGAAARAMFSSRRGSLASQVALRTLDSSDTQVEIGPIVAPVPRLEKATVATDLLFWNGFGGFSRDGNEYVIATNNMTPAPWCNVLANPTFGCLTSESALGYSWAGNSQMNRLTPWSNDPVSDTPGEVVYLRDEQTGEIWTLTPLPLGQSTTTTTKHGQGYSSYEGKVGSLHHALTVHVAASDPIKIIHLTLRNNGPKARTLRSTYFVEWVLGTLRENAPGRIECAVDAELHALVAKNLWSSAFPEKLAFAASSLEPQSFTCDRREFLGRNGSIAQPLGLRSHGPSGGVGNLIDPCAAFTVELSILPGESTELVFVLGQADNRDEMHRLIRDYADPRLSRRSLAAVRERWDKLLGSVTVRTPDAAFDIMMNRWLLYQVLVCRIWARTGFYQSGGAYGFRDQLQDVMALVHCAPEETRAHILRAASRQFEEGDVQHWWHPPSGVGVRTRMTDDLYFLPYVVQYYAQVTGDFALLDEHVPFISSPTLADDQEESFGLPEISRETESLYEHCCRALERGLRVGSHGIPLMGTGDWNDGMNKVGAEGRGESVWNGWFFVTVLKSFATVASARGDQVRAAWCNECSETLRASLEAHAWDGAWYRRAYFDDGTPLGSSANDECQIDAIPQAWAVISGAADTRRATKGMQAVWQRLVRSEDKLIQLFDPPFDSGPLQPGYIKGYVPGIRENGGQYTHAAAWVVLATAMLGDADRAFRLWSMLNPINHALSRKEAEHYKVEPYVVSADIYGAAPHTGRGGWTWYTGSAAWLYRVGLEAILGIRRQGDCLFIEPCVPSTWPSYEVDIRFGTTLYRISVSRGTQGGHEYHLSVDGDDLTSRSVPLVDDGSDHVVRLVVG